ncbi:hypothetical protein ACFLX7_03890 [Chloroflexota bacterium]
MELDLPPVQEEAEWAATALGLGLVVTASVPVAGKKYPTSVVRRVTRSAALNAVAK